MESILTVAFFISTLIMILLILLRKSDVGSLSSAFGGVGGDTAFGVKAQKQLDKLITVVAVLFVGLAVLLNMPFIRKSSKEITPTNQQAPATPTTPEKNN